MSTITMRVVFLETKPEYGCEKVEGKVIVDDTMTTYFGQFGASRGSVNYLDTHNDVAKLAAEEGHIVGHIVGGCTFRMEGKIITLSDRSMMFGPISKGLMELLQQALQDQGFEVTILDW